jgi:hypothetical protein
MANLFKKAASKSTSQPVKAKDEKIHLNVEDPTFFDKVQKLEALNDQMKIAKAKADIISDEVRDIAKSAWIKQYDKMGKNPESVLVVQEKGEDTARIQFIPTDKYISINSARAEELRETYGEEIVTEETSFGFDSSMIEKYGEILSRLIEECDEIPAKDKEKIITAKTTFTVAKGTIDKLDKYGDVSEVMENVKPVVMLKNIEVIKG